MSAVAFLLNRARTELPAMALLALLVGATAFLAALAPRLFNAVADDGLRHRIVGAEPGERNLELGRLGFYLAGQGTDAIAEEAPRLQSELPSTVASLITGSTWWAESANWAVIDPPGPFPSWIRFRFAEGVDDRITYVEGREPTGETETIPGSRGTIPGEPEDATVFEIALSVEIAESLGVGIGDRLDLQPDTEDFLVGQFSSPVRAAADVVGLYTVDDPDAEYWMDDPSLNVPTVIVISPNVHLIYGAALLSPDAYRAVLEKGFPARYGWRYFVDPERFDAGLVDELATDLRQMTTRYPGFVTNLNDMDVTTLRTSLLRLVEGYAAERRTAEAVLVTAALGPAAVALAAVALVALLIIHRRRRALTVLRGRGGSVGQLLGSHLLEGLLVAVPAALVGYLAAIMLVDARASPLSAIGAGGVAVGAALVLVAMTLRPATAPLRDLERETPTGSRLSPRRMALEALVIVLAVGGAILLRQRGLAGGSAAGALGGADPLLAATPALIGLAGAVVTVRLYPLPVRAVGWFADGWRGMVPALGLRRAARTGDVGSLPLIVLLVTVAIGAFSSTVFVTLERGQVAAAWQAIGADFVIEPSTRPVPSDFDATTLPGVEAAARMHVDNAALGGRGGQRVQMHALETAAYADVTRGTGADPRLPAAMTAAPLADEPLPAIVSGRVASEGARAVRAGDEVTLTVGSREVTIRVLDVRAAFPGIDPSSAWLVLPLDWLSAALGDRAFSASAVFVRAPGIAAGDLQRAVDEVLPATDVRGRADHLEALQAGPLARGVASGFVIAVGVAIVYAALATTAALVLVAMVRAREEAHLRTLGMTRGGLLALAAIEHGPAIVAATAIGVALGVGVAWFVAPGLDLSGLIGSSVEVALVVEPTVVALLVGALVAVLALSIWLSSTVARRAGLVASTRAGIEEG
jgi:putative ABC transport system permease protein